MPEPTIKFKYLGSRRDGWWVVRDWPHVFDVTCDNGVWKCNCNKIALPCRHIAAARNRKIHRDDSGRELPIY